MKGYWHVVAISVTAAFISILLEWNLLPFLFLWLGFLYMTKRLPLIPLLISTLGFVFFIQQIPVLDTDKVPSERQQMETIQGKIIKSPVIQMNKVEVVLENPKDDKILVIYFPEDENQRIDPYHLRYGANCIARGKIGTPESARNPGEFDYRKFLLTQGIEKQMILKDLNDIECKGSSFLHRFYSLRQKLIRQMEERVSGFTAAWINALILGDTSMVNDDTIKLFQDWGLSHLLAISGLHIGIVIGLIYFLLVRMNWLTKEKAEILIMLFLPVYALLAGGEPSVLRASLMALLILFLRRLHIMIPATDAISIIFVLLLLYDPYLIYNIGFQFSFIITFGIILSRRWLASVSSPVFQLLIISFISQMIILPIQLNYFSLFQPLSIIMNLLIVPYFSIFVIPYMFFMMFISFLPISILHSFDLLFSGIHLVVIEGIKWLDRYFDYPFYLTDLPVWLTIFYYLLLLVALHFLEENRLNKSFISFFLMASLLVGYAAIPYVTGKGTVTMLDIGQGDAFIIELPYRKGVIMIDAGATFSFEDMEPSPTNYERIIKPYLRSNGIHHIDALFITHEDTDHFGSLSFMLQDDVVREIYVSEYFQFPIEILNLTEEKSVPIRRLRAQEAIQINGLHFSVLAPIVDKGKSNENSLVLYTEIGGKSWLFTGDISKEEERDIMRTYNFNVDIIKVAHHGSNTSTDPAFIEKLSPDTALIPVGKNNSYGHPTGEVIETLETFNIGIYRTDHHGAVQYIFQKDEGNFYTFLPSHRK